MSSEPASSDPASVSSFVVEEGSGLKDPDTPTEHIDRLAAVQAVPLAPELGGSVRIFFEAEAEDGANQLFQLDSVDGWIGSERSTLCPSWSSGSS